ncbi:MAG TPA: DUF4105 domain-containing protein [Polyangiaceae bacterium]|nr:DUF4105 domain-containing protein [Polyangiaceae bacterium]
MAALVALSVLLPRESAAADEDPVDEPATTQGDPRYASELVARARTMHLAEEVEWLRLGHWHLGPDRTMLGEADGPLFWLAAHGKRDPQAELDATLRAIWDPQPADERIQHPFCRFPARMMWLDSRLHFDVLRLPNRGCARYAHFLAKLRPAGAALVFSSYFLNSPASAFGHTFLRIHKAGRTHENELLDTGVDFAATVDTGNALLYAIKGLAGMFPGAFHALPYYYKVREYNDYESRDLWEYELALSPQALAMLVAHLWEEGSTYFDYFYLSENCSYHVLAAIEVSDPSLDLLGHVKFPLVPIDTVRALFDNPGLVRKIRYRPSLRSNLRREMSALTPEQADFVAALVANADEPAPPSMSAPDVARALDAASDVVDVREAKAVLKADDPRVERLKQRILERRADIAIPTAVIPPPVPLDQMPHAGHPTARFALGTGYSPDLGGEYFELRHRLALHDLADPPVGFPQTAAIEFLPFSLRLYPKARSLELEDLSILRVVSLSPWARFQRPMSWMVDAGAARVRDDGCPGCLAGYAKLAAGATAAFGADDAFALFALAAVNVQYSSGMHGAGDSDVRPGIGPIGGVRWRAARTLVLTASASLAWLPDANPALTWVAEGSARWGLAPDVALGVDLRWQPLAVAGSFSAFVYY